MKKIFFFLAVMLPMMWACTPSEKKTERFHYHIDSLLDNQIRWLARSKAQLEKSAQVDDKADTRRLQPDSLGWVEQLSVFRQMEAINKPSLFNLYKVERGNDTHSNLEKISFTSTESVPIPHLSIYFLKDLHHVKRIEASTVESNALLETQSKLVLDFEDEKGKAVLTAYRIEGFQKMVLADSVHFSVMGLINP